MRNTIRLVVVLAVIAAVSGGVLAFVYQATSSAINHNKQLALEKAILQVLPEASSYTVAGSSSEDNSVPASADKNGGQGPILYYGLTDTGTPAGVAFVAQGSGFQGIIKIMVGVDPVKRQLIGIKVLEHLETPGLGARITEPWFENQFQGKSIDDPFVAKQDVDAITGATISSQAVATILKNTLKQVDEKLTIEGERQ